MEGKPPPLELVGKGGLRVSRLLGSLLLGNLSLVSLLESQLLESQLLESQLLESLWLGSPLSVIQSAPLSLGGLLLGEGCLESL